jgi:hypothetical protein
MYEFLLIALAVIYVTISYPPSSRKPTVKPNTPESQSESPAPTVAHQNVRHQSNPVVKR